MKRILLLSLLLTSCGKHDSASTQSTVLPTKTVKVLKVTRETLRSTEEIVGTVRSKQRAIVEAKISGRILEYRATPGASVTIGELLARVDASDLQAKVDQAKASLEQARREDDRQKQLMAGNATTRQEVDSAQTRLKLAIAANQEAETMMSYARITAPFDGVVTRKLAEVGDLAMPGKPLLELENPADLRFETDVPEAVIDRVKLGDTLQVTIGKTIGTTVGEISPIADPVSRTFVVKLDLPRVEGLRTGQFGRVAIPMAESQIIAVPQSTVQLRGQLEIVYVVKNDQASLRLIQTGKVIGEKIQVLSGLEDGEQLILGQVQEGQPVSVQP